MKEADISTHAPAGGATTSAVATTPALQFLLTPLREGRHGTVSASDSAPGFLLTPLREGRLFVPDIEANVTGISTHAPAGGATSSNVCICHALGISTHAPAGGATRKILLPDLPCTDFYSRPCGRGDPWRRAERRKRAYFYSRPCGRGDEAHTDTVDGLKTISTHAPAGGATCSSQISKPTSPVFLLTPLREGRPALHVPAAFLTKFLLTPLREGRRFRQAARPSAPPISTHAPAGGATHCGLRVLCDHGHISTHAPAGGATGASATEKQSR